MERPQATDDRDNITNTIGSSTQVVHWVRREAAALLSLPEARVRCVALDVGGGFGGKGHVYPEDLLITFLVRRLGRPVRWIEDRREHMMSATHSRDQLHDVEVGFDDNGRIIALRDNYIVDCGAWNPLSGSGVAYNTAVHLTGPYKIENLAASGRIAVTNKVPNAPYRGAGRPKQRSRWNGPSTSWRGRWTGAGRGATAQHDPRRRDAVSGRHPISRRRTDRR